MKIKCPYGEEIGQDEVEIEEATGICKSSTVCGTTCCPYIPHTGETDSRKEACRLGLNPVILIKCVLSGVCSEAADCCCSG
jgi:hypothetical protein